VLLVCVIAGSASVGATELKPKAAVGFDRYVRLTELRMQGELEPGGAFLWADGLSEPGRDDVYARLQRGEVISAKLKTDDPLGGASTPGALIHHWVGMIYIPGASL